MEETFFICEKYFGSVDIRTWFEPGISDDGAMKFIGKSCKTSFDRDGKVTAVEFSDTGVTMQMS